MTLDVNLDGKSEDEIIDSGPMSSPPEDEIEKEEEKEEDKEEEEEKEEESENEEEEKEEEEKEEDEEKPKESLVKAIDKKYPGVFKDFPELRKNFFLAREYQEVFPDIDSAKEAVENNQILHAFEEQILEGDSSLLLGSIIKEGGDVANRFVENLLPTLFKTSKEHYVKATRPLVAELLQDALNIGEANKDKNLINAAKVLSKQIFGTYELPKFARKDDEEEKKVTANKNKEQQEKFNEFRSEFFVDAEDEVRDLIRVGFDPDKVLPDFVRKSALDSIYEELNSILTKDGTHMARIQNMWTKVPLNDRRALKAHKERMITTLLSRAKTEIPALKKKYLNEALGRLNRKPKTETKNIPHGTPPGRKKGNEKITMKEVREKNLTEDDILGLE